MEIGSYLKMLRIDNNLSQKQLSQNVCSQAVLSKIENNITIPNAVLLYRLCNRLKISVDDFFLNLHSVDSQLESHNEFYLLTKAEFSFLKLDLQSTHKYLKMITPFFENSSLINHESELQMFYFLIGVCEFYKNESTSAIKKFYASLNYFEKNIFSTEKNEIIHIFCHFFIGQNYISQDKKKVAIEYFKIALQLFQNLPNNVSDNFFPLLCYQGTLYTQNKNKKLFNLFKKRGTQWCKKQNSTFLLAEFTYLEVLSGSVHGKEEISYLTFSKKLLELEEPLSTNQKKIYNNINLLLEQKFHEFFIN